MMTEEMVTIMYLGGETVLGIGVGRRTETIDTGVAIEIIVTGERVPESAIGGGGTILLTPDDGAGGRTAGKEGLPKLPTTSLAR